MSETPRTDALIAELDANHEVAIPFVWRQMVNLARQLESALAAMTAQAAEAEAEVENWKLVAYKNGDAEIAEAARAQATERRSQEREAWLLGHISEEEHMRFVERFQ